MRPALPEIPTQGGPVIAHVELVTVTFAGYPYKETVEAFGDWVVQSAWLQQAGAEYGVGTGKHLQKIVLPESAPATLSQPEADQFILAKIVAGVFPAPTDNSVYVVYYPASTEVDPVVRTTFEAR